MSTGLTRADPLTYTLANNWLIDMFRVVACILGLMLLLMAMHRWLEHKVHGDGVALMGLGLFTLVQEAEQLGNVFVPWRLPVLIVCCAAGITYLYGLSSPLR